jgi:hypothetical protein
MKKKCKMRAFIFCTFYKSKKMRWVGYVAHVGRRRNTRRILVRKPEAKR